MPKKPAPKKDIHIPIREDSSMDFTKAAKTKMMDNSDMTEMIQKEHKSNKIKRGSMMKEAARVKRMQKMMYTENK